MGGCIFFAIVLFIIIAFVIAQANAKQADAQWAAVAEELKLNFVPSGFLKGRRIEGALRGCCVTIDTFTRSHGKHSKSYTRYTAHFPDPLGLGMRLTRQGLLSPVLTFFGAQDIHTGDPGFDKDVVVKARDSHGIIDFLTRERRERIRGLLTTVGECIITDDRIELVEPGVQRDPSQLAGTIRRLVRVVNYLSRDEAEASAEPVVHAMELPEPPAPIDATIAEAQPLHVPGRRTPPPVPMAEVEPQYTYTPPPVPAEPVRLPVVEPTPMPKPIETPLIPTASEPISEPAPPAAPPLDLSAEAVCRDLFDPKNMSFQVTSLFDERYRNKHISWTGTLRRVSGYASDLVFGNEPGAKATMDICQFDGGFMGTTTVQAVVQYPPDAEPALQRQIGEKVAFSGRLAGCDGFTRAVYVTIDPG